MAVDTRGFPHPEAREAPDAQEAQEAPSDRELLHACRAGDALAWERLVAKYERLVYSIPLSYGLSADDASDITQLCFTCLFQQLDSLDEDSRLAAWLATVAKRQTWRLIRRRKRNAERRSEISLGAQTLVDRAAGLPYERSEQKDWLEGGLASLDDGCRDLLVALYFDPRLGSYSHTSEHLRIPMGSIGPMRSRCLERLRKALEQVPDDSKRPCQSGRARSTSRNGDRRRCP